MCLCSNWKEYRLGSDGKTCERNGLSIQHRYGRPNSNDIATIDYTSNLKFFIWFFIFYLFFEEEEDEN